MKTSSAEKEIGIEVFASASQGISGLIKQVPEDFIVEEILLDGSRAKRIPEPPSRLGRDSRYLICSLIKRNWETIFATRVIARKLGISEGRIQTVGLKDKRAVTAQHVSIESIKMEELKRIMSEGLIVQPLRYSPNMVFPHMLYGNAFHIAIRRIEYPCSVITDRTEATLNRLRSLGGFPNFFGHQRFGVMRPITHQVGKALAEGSLEKAALLFLAERSPWEHSVSRLAREHLSRSCDFETAFEEFPKNLFYERLMLSYLSKHPEDYTGAFRQLPSRLRRLFLHAYQSYLFNCFLSERAKREIPIEEPQSGDYVLKVDSNGLPSRSHIKATSRNLEDLRQSVRKRRMCVGLPLIGFRQCTSEGVQGEIEHSILQREKMTLQDFHVSSMPEVSAGGGLRATVAQIQGLRFEMPRDDKLNSLSRKLELNFTLHRGCYATSFLREIMKPDNLVKAGF